ncbi:MAG: hypothetical protein ACYDDF_14820 [Thermoplasmatota archaeon]
MATPTENAPFGLLDAANAIAKAQRWDVDLRRRTEGISWMIWGIITAAIFLSYPLASAFGAPDWAYAVLWLPWTFAGYAIMFALWRTAHLASPQDVARPGFGRYVALAGIYMVIFTLDFVVLHPQTAAIPMLLAGILWAGMGLFMPAMSTKGKVVSLVIGVTTALCSVAITALAIPYPESGFLASALVGLVPLAGGFYHALAA